MKDVNLELVKKMGSRKGYDPIPPDQYLYFLYDADPVQRVVAWVRSKTLRKSHRSPWAVTPGGRPHSKADMARDIFDGDRSNAGRAWDKTAALGLVFENQQGYLCLNGAVKRPAKPGGGDGDGTPDGKTETSSIPASVLKDIQSLPAAMQSKALASFETFSVFRNSVESDALTLARMKCDEYEDSMYEAFGLKKRRLEKKRRPELHEKGSDFLQVKVRFVPEALRPYFDAAQAEPTETEPSPAEPTPAEPAETDFVQTTLSVRTNHENGFAQTTHIRTEEQRVFSPSPSPVSPAAAAPFETPNAAAAAQPETAPVMEALNHFGQADQDTAERIISRCREQYPQVSTADIVSAIEEKGAAGLKKRARDPIALLVATVPKLFVNYKPKPAADPRLDKRAQNVAFLREHWHEFPPDEQLNYLREFPEVANLMGLAQNGTAH